jgi:transposase
MAVADRHALPVAVHIESATPHEVKLVVPTLVEMVIPEAPENLVGDNAYDSDKLDAELCRYGIQLISPHRSNRKNRTQDRRRLRRYRRRWKIERLFAWLQNFRRLVVPHIEVGGSAVKTRMKGVKKTRPNISAGVQSAGAPIVNRMAPGVVDTELCSPPRETPAIQSKLKSLETGTTSIRTISEVRNFRVESRQFV